MVIIGAGPIGCFHAQMAKIRGAKCVIMVEINDKRLEMAKQFGVDYTINSLKEDPVVKIKQITNNKGADKVISANPSSSAQAQSIFMAKAGGIVVFLVVFQKERWLVWIQIIFIIIICGFMVILELIVYKYKSV